MAIASGSIIAAVAVLLIHIERNAVAAKKPIETRWNEPPPQRTSERANHRSTPWRAMAAAITNPPKNTKISGSANEASDDFNSVAPVTAASRGTISEVTGSGTINANGDSVDTVRVNCAFVATLRGTVIGLAPGAALVLANGSDTVSLSASGAFAFSRTLVDGTAYNVSVLTQPAIGSCSVANASGSFFAASFVDIVINCN